MNFFQSVSCVGGRSYDMVSPSQKQTNSPVTIRGGKISKKVRRIEKDISAEIISVCDARLKAEAEGSTRQKLA